MARGRIEYFGDDAFNPLIIQFIFLYFLGLCLSLTLLITDGYS